MTSQFPNWMINSRFSIPWPVSGPWYSWSFSSGVSSVLLPVCDPTIAWFSSHLSAAPPQSHLLLTCPVSTEMPHPQVTTLKPLDWSHSGSWLPILPMSWLPSVHFSLNLSLELQTHMTDCFLIIQASWYSKRHLKLVCWNWSSRILLPNPSACLLHFSTSQLRTFSSSIPKPWSQSHTL